MKGRFFPFLMLGALASASNSLAASSENLALGLKVREDLVEIRVKNTSDYPINISDFFVDAGADTGFWVYLYDQSAKRLVHPSAMYQAPLRSTGESFQKSRLLPGKEKTFNHPLADVLKFFGSSSRCNWLVVVYAKNEGSNRVRSLPSKPVFVCQ